MLRIPYIPTAYPDEMLASLLTRLRLHNGSGLWRSLAKELGYGQSPGTPFFHPPDQDAKLERLLTTLGYTYSQMLRELTVFPFWLSFNHADRKQINIDAASGPLTSPTQVGRRASIFPGARFCPACLRDDIEVYGEPYLHRHHQLPVAVVCTNHGVPLEFACPACGSTVMPFNQYLLGPPLLRCECGKDLSGVAGPPVANQQALIRLSRFAADTLSCTRAPWTRNQILTVLYERSSMNPGSFRESTMQLLHDTYGPSDTSQGNLGNLVTWENIGSSLRLMVGANPSQLRAPEFCALLAAAGLSFDEFRCVMSQTEVTASSKSVMSGRFTIEFARREFERFKAESPERAASRFEKWSVRLFWLLRIFDSAYLREHGYRPYKPIPTIKADREEIEKLLRQGAKRKFERSWARIRASIRDQAWLQRVRAQNAELNNQRWQARQARRQAAADKVQQTRAMALSRSVFSLLNTEARPKRITARNLAKASQISSAQAVHTIDRTPALKALIAAVNAGKDRRLAFWAARSLIKGGSDPSPKEVMVRAHLSRTKVNRQFSIQAIANFTDNCKIAQSER